MWQSEKKRRESWQKACAAVGHTYSTTTKQCNTEITTQIATGCHYLAVCTAAVQSIEGVCLQSHTGEGAFCGRAGGLVAPGLCGFCVPLLGGGGSARIRYRYGNVNRVHRMVDSSRRVVVKRSTLH